MKLKPCPWCGGVELKSHAYITINNPKSAIHVIRCTGCGAEGPQATNEDQAREAWNDRAEATS